MQNLSIVLAGGGTAGHVIPSLAILSELKRSFSAVTYIGSRDGVEKRLAEAAGLPYRGVTTVKFRRTLSADNFKIPFRLFKGISEAEAILREIQPNVVFSKGGYAALPVALAAKRCGIPVVLHESDYTPGLANKLCSKKAVAVCTSFPDTAKRFGERGVYTGTPIRRELAEGNAARVRNALHFSAPPRPVLLVMGGSSGAVAVNNAVRQALPVITKNFRVVHLTGKGNLAPELDSGAYRQIEYADNPADLFAVSDVVLSRAGSNAVNELLFLKKPMLLVPLPKTESRGDQLLNAEYFRARGWAEVLPQEQCGLLAEKLEEVYRNRERYRAAMSSADVPDGRKAVVREILRACGAAIETD